MHECEVCDSRVPIGGMWMCPVCQSYVCDTCYHSWRRMCDKCVKKADADMVKTLKALLARIADKEAQHEGAYVTKHRDKKGGEA